MKNQAYFVKKYFEKFKKNSHVSQNNRKFFQNVMPHVLPLLTIMFNTLNFQTIYNETNKHIFLFFVSQQLLLFPRLLLVFKHKIVTKLIFLPALEPPVKKCLPKNGHRLRVYKNRSTISTKKSAYREQRIKSSQIPEGEYDPTTFAISASDVQ